jgi:hypothetical protein
MDGSFALANNLNQLIILKYPENTASLVFKRDVNDMTKTAKEVAIQLLEICGILKKGSEKKYDF